MGEKAEPKISLPEIVFIGLFLAILDAIDLIPFAGDITDVFAAPLLFYYFFKNINGIAYAVSLVLDAIPFTQEFPTRSLVWWGTVAFDHFAPKQLSQAVEKIGEAEEGGAGGEAEGALEETENVAKEGAQQAEQTAGGIENEAQGGRVQGQTEENVQENQPKDEGENAKEKDDRGDIELGSEISPDEEAANTDFGPSEEEQSDEDKEDEEEEPKADNKVVDIRTRKPLNNSGDRNSEDDHYQKAA